MLAPAAVLRSCYTALGYRSAAVARSGKLGPGVTLQPGASGDYHLRFDRETLAGEGDRLQRDAGLYQGITRRWLDSVLGPEGFTLDPNTGNRRLDVRIRDDWTTFGMAPEVRGLFTWQECQRIALLGIANNGDGGALLRRPKRGAPETGRYQFFEGDELNGGRVIPGGEGYRVEQGVELTRDGRPVAFWLCDRDKAGFIQKRTARRFLSRDVAYWPNLEKFSQTRGAPVMQAVFAMVHRLEDICTSEAVAWQTLAKFAMAIERAGGPELAYAESKQDDDERDPGSSGDGQAADRIQEYDEAIVFHCEPGEKATPISRTLPGRDFPESVRMFLRLAGLPLGLPLEVILLDYSKTNYTGSRAALEQAYRMFITWQRWLMCKLHSPLYLAWLTWQVAAGIYPDRPSTYVHTWSAPEFPWIDQLKEAEAWGKRMDRGLATQGQALKSVNMDRDDWLEARKTEVKEAIEAADELNKAHPGANVPWEMFAGLPVSKTRGVDDGQPPDGGDGGDAPPPVDEPAPQQDGDAPPEEPQA